MAYEAVVNGEHAIVRDKDGKSIASIHHSVDTFTGANTHHITPVFKPDMAHRIVKALNLADAIDALQAGGSN